MFITAWEKNVNCASTFIISQNGIFLLFFCTRTVYTIEITSWLVSSFRWRQKINNCRGGGGHVHIFVFTECAN